MLFLLCCVAACSTTLPPQPRNGESRALVTDDLVEFEKQPTRVQGFKKSVDNLKGIYEILSTLLHENQRGFDLFVIYSCGTQAAFFDHLVSFRQA
jgi:hypothetical protein